MNIAKFVVGDIEANCYVVYDEKNCFIIDPGAEAERIKRFIKQKNLNCLFIVNTHGHIDHIGANNEFDLPIIIHKDDETLLYDPELNLSAYFGLPFVSRKAERLIEDKEIIDFSGFIFEVIHTPGHTPGSICLKCKDCLFTGDTLFSEGIGRTDFPYSSEENLIKSIKEKIFTLDSDVKIFPGHGPPSSIGKEKRNFYF